jgi:hypothetical protein
MAAHAERSAASLLHNAHLLNAQGRLRGLSLLRAILAPNIDNLPPPLRKADEKARRQEERY